MIKDSGGFVMIKDSGKRKKYSSGMVRDVDTNKPRYDLIPLHALKDWGRHMAEGAAKYSPKNWEKANSLEELERFKASAWRHFIDYMGGNTGERHHSALFFNISAIEFMKEKLGVDIHGNKVG